MSQQTTSAAPLITSRFGPLSTALEIVAGVDLAGKNAIVTGGGSGLGAETVRALAAAGAQVTIADFNLDAARDVAARIADEIGETRVGVEFLDLGDLATVRLFAERWNAKPLNLLLNNAGVMACPHGYTKDGFERQFGINYLGHFLVTLLLTPALRLGRPARVVSLSSAGHMHSDVDFDDPHYRDRPYQPLKAYGQSKTAIALFTGEYDRRHRERGIRAFAIQPGVIAATNLGQHMTRQLLDQLGLTPAREEGSSISDGGQYKTIEQGAATSVWAAVAPELADAGGLYLEDCAQAPRHGPDLPPFHGIMDYAQDPAAAERLWDLSIESVRDFL